MAEAKEQKESEVHEGVVEDPAEQSKSTGLMRIRDMDRDQALTLIKKRALINREIRKLVFMNLDPEHFIMMSNYDQETRTYVKVPYLLYPGTSIAKEMYGVTVEVITSNGPIWIDVDEGVRGYYFEIHGQAYFSESPNEKIVEIGSASTRETKFHINDKNVTGGKRWRELHEINMFTDVKNLAITRMKQRAVKDLLGLNRITIDELREAWKPFPGKTIEKIKGYSFASKSSYSGPSSSTPPASSSTKAKPAANSNGPITDDQSRAVENLIRAKCPDDFDSALKYAKENVTTFGTAGAVIKMLGNLTSDVDVETLITMIKEEI